VILLTYSSIQPKQLALTVSGYLACKLSGSLSEHCWSFLQKQPHTTKICCGGTIIQRGFASAVCQALRDVRRNAGQTVVSTV